MSYIEDSIFHGSYARKANSKASRALLIVPLCVWSAAYFIFFRTEFHDIVPHNKLLIVITAIALLCLFVREILYSVWTKRTIAGAAVALVSAAFMLTGTWASLIAMPAFIFCARNVSLRSVVSVFLPLCIAVVLFVIACACAGVIPNETLLWGGRTRACLGFLHPNVLGAMIFFIFCQIIYIRSWRFTIFEAVIMLLLTVGLAALTDSRTAVIACAGLVCVAYFFKFIPSRALNCNLFGIVAALLCGGFLCSAMLVSVFYDPSVDWMYDLNKLLSGRLFLAHYYIQNFEIGLLGQNIAFGDLPIDIINGTAQDSLVSAPVDIAIVRTALLCGLPFAFFSILLVAFSAWWCWRSRQPFASLLIVIIACYSISEAYSAFLYMNPFLFCICHAFGIDWISRGKAAGRNIKLCVASHKPYWMPKDEMYLPVQVNAAAAETRIDGFQADDEGDNISHDNARYCELTAVYWAWKNLQADAVGLAHYRRHFAGLGDKHTLTCKDAAALLEQAPVVVMNKRCYFIETVEDHYGHTFHVRQLEILRRAIQACAPDCIETFNECMHKRSAHIFNMFIMRREQFDAYCEWMFPILREAEKHIDFKHLDAFQQRVMGRLSERLLDTWLIANDIDIVECPITNIEGVNWLKKGSAFLRAKFFNKKYEASF